MFAQRRKRLTTHFSERIPVVTRRISPNYRLKRKSCVAKLVNKWRGDSFLQHLLRLLFAQLPWLSCHALRTDQHVNSCRWFSAFLCYRCKLERYFKCGREGGRGHVLPRSLWCEDCSSNPFKGTTFCCRSATVCKITLFWDATPCRCVV